LAPQHNELFAKPLHQKWSKQNQNPQHPHQPAQYHRRVTIPRSINFAIWLFPSGASSGALSEADMLPFSTGGNGFPGTTNGPAVFEGWLIAPP